MHTPSPVLAPLQVKQLGRDGYQGWIWAACFLQDLQSFLLTGTRMANEWRVSEDDGVKQRARHMLRHKANDAIKEK